MKALILKSVKMVLGTAEWLFSKPKYEPDELLVLCYHSTPKHYFDAFKNQFQWYKSQGFKVLSASQLDAFYRGEIKDGPYVLFTFDDGLENNQLAANFLNEQGVDAFFFLVPTFIQSEKSEQPAYYQRVMRPIINAAWEPMAERHAMSIDEVKGLMGQGHVMGAHTYTHGLEASETDNVVLQQENVGVKEYLEKELGTSISSFCSINQTDWSVNQTSAELIKKNYAYHFTTFPGENTAETSKLCVFRRNVEVFWPMAEVKFAMGKWMLGRWQERIKACRADLGI